MMARKQTKQLCFARDLDAENDVVLRTMLESGTPLTLENYLDIAFLGNPPEGIEEDGEFLASVPDVISNGPRRGQLWLRPAFGKR
jgi:hypothetical protein